MEPPTANARTVAPDDSEAQRVSTRLIERIRKLRWIGMEDEANLLKAELASFDVSPVDTVLAEPRDTD